MAPRSGRCAIRLPSPGEFRTAAGEVLAISIPRAETAVVRHFQERMPYGLFVPDVNAI